MTFDQLVVLAFVATLVVPTIAFIAVRRTRRGPRPRAAKVMAWLCLWTGQLAAPMVGVVLIAVHFGASYWASDLYLLALVYGLAMIGLASFLFAQSVRVLVIGTLALGQATEETIAVLARHSFPRGLVAIGVTAMYLYVLPVVLPMPGRFDEGIYWALAVMPVSITALLVTLLAGLMRKPPWRGV